MKRRSIYWERCKPNFTTRKERFDRTEAGAKKWRANCPRGKPQTKFSSSPVSFPVPAELIFLRSGQREPLILLRCIFKVLLIPLPAPPFSRHFPFNCNSKVVAILLLVLPHLLIPLAVPTFLLIMFLYGWNLGFRAFAATLRGLPQKLLTEQESYERYSQLHLWLQLSFNILLASEQKMLSSIAAHFPSTSTTTLVKQVDKSPIFAVSTGKVLYMSV
jgi:hypothetical protein